MTPIRHFKIRRLDPYRHANHLRPLHYNSLEMSGSAWPDMHMIFMLDRWPELPKLDHEEQGTELLHEETKSRITQNGTRVWRSGYDVRVQKNF